MLVDPVCTAKGSSLVLLIDYRWWYHLNPASNVLSIILLTCLSIVPNEENGNQILEKQSVKVLISVDVFFLAFNNNTNSMIITVNCGPLYIASLRGYIYPYNSTVEGAVVKFSCQTGSLMTIRAAICHHDGYLGYWYPNPASICQLGILPWQNKTSCFTKILWLC